MKKYPPTLGSFSDEQVAETKRIFQPYRKEPISDYDARDMLRNVSGFFEVLADWERKRREKAATKDAAQAESEDPAEPGKGGHKGEGPGAG